MDNAVLIRADGTAVPVTIEGFEDSSLACVLGAAEVKRCWSHQLIAFGTKCKVAMMGYVDAEAQQKGLAHNAAASGIVGEPVQGDMLLTYWDNMRMSWGAMEPQEVERAVEALEE